MPSQSSQASQGSLTQSTQANSQETVIRGFVGGRPRFGAKAKFFDEQEGKRSRKRHRPGEKVLKEIRKYQKSTDNLMPREPFKRLVREVITEISLMKFPRMEGQAFTALQEASEAFLTTFFDAVNRCAVHANRMTIMPSDFALVRWILNAFGHTFI